MGAFSHRGHSIGVLERGPEDGEVVVLHHGLFQSGAGFDRAGLVDAVAETHRVWAIDSYGHGTSDDVDDDELLGRDGRADLVAALADDRGVDRFHFVGYSMGGWVGGALARRHPDRLRSVSIGGWDVVDGMATSVRAVKELLDIDLTFDLLLDLGRPVMPEVADAGPERIAGWRRTHELLDAEAPDDLAVLGSLGVPLHLWCGRDDAYHAAMASAAESTGARFDSVPGDHFTAFHTHEVRDGLRAFLAGG